MTTVSVAAFLMIVYAARHLTPPYLAVLAALYGLAEDQVWDDADALVRAVHKLPPAVPLPAGLHVLKTTHLPATAMEALLHSYESAAVYLPKKVVAAASQRYVPPPTEGPDRATLRERAAAVAEAQGLTALAARLRAAKTSNALVDLVVAVAEATFLPELRARFHHLAARIDVAARASARAAMHPRASAREREVMPLKWLRPLGLAADEYETVRRWHYEYVVYGHSDDDYRKRALEFGRHSLMSYLTVVRYFRRQELYRRESEVILRPAEEGAAIFQVLRKRVCLLAYEPTPRELGMAYFCAGCQRLATVCQDAPANLATRQQALNQQLVLEEEEQARWITRTNGGAASGRARPPAVVAAQAVMTSAAPQTLVQVGQSTHLLSVDQADIFCKHAKTTKRHLTELRRQAGCDDGAAAAAKRATPDEDDDPEDEEEEEDAEEEENEEDEGEDTDVEDLLINLDDLEEVPVAAIGRQDNPALPPEEARAAATADGQKKAKTAKKSSAGTLDKRVLSQLLTGAMATATAVSSAAATAACSAQPLLAVDLVAAWIRLKGVYYGRCVFCGNVTAVEPEKLSVHGLSCLNHRPGNLSSLPPKHPHLLDRLVACVAAGCSNQTNRFIRVHDGTYATYEMPLCHVHLGALGMLQPLLRCGDAKAPKGLYPLPLSDVCAVLDDLEAQRVRRATPMTRARPSIYAMLQEIIEAVGRLTPDDQLTLATHRFRHQGRAEDAVNEPGVARWIEDCWERLAAAGGGGR